MHPSALSLPQNRTALCDYTIVIAANDRPLQQSRRLGSPSFVHNIFLVPIILSSGSHNQKRVKMQAIAFMLVSLIGFVAIYNIQYADRWGGDILNIIFDFASP